MSTMQQAAAEYLQMRQALGYKLITQGRLVMSFAGAMDAAGQETLTIRAAVDWASHPPRGTRPEYWCRRLEAVRLFARHMHALDPAHEVPPRDILPFRAYRRIGGHRYTAEETAALITAAGRLRPRLRALTWQTFLALLSVTGLRPREACRLDDDDIDLDGGSASPSTTSPGRSRWTPRRPRRWERTCASGTR
jgi:integrase/recombinase XerD